MAWHCRLYGHQWRHPGTYEVHLTGNGVPAYPFQCAICDSDMLLETRSDEHPVPETGRLETPSTSDLEDATTSELEAEDDLSEP